jgi:hypothetical protein
MSAFDGVVSVPAEAWAFADRLGMREAFADYLSMAEDYYSPVAELVVEFDGHDPTFEDEQMTLNVHVSPGGRVGGDADLEWMRRSREHFSPALLTRITPYSQIVDSTSEAAHART